MMIMTKYRKKPVVIEAIQWTGENVEEVSKFAGNNCSIGLDHVWIDTLEGVMRTDKGDYIIKGIKGEFYPCKPDIFEATYERHLVWDENL
jgi:hypothetical protein